MWATGFDSTPQVGLKVMSKCRMTQSYRRAISLHKVDIMDFEAIKNYWDDRAAGDSSIQSTTQDVYLREIEFRVLKEELKLRAPQSVVDVGCGDGRTTIRLASVLPTIKFQGFDYSPSMLINAKAVLRKEGVDNTTFGQHDISQPLPGSFEAAYTTRCLINLPNWELQQAALKNIHTCLPIGGIYLMVENFVEGQMNFNRIRKAYSLPEIAVRNHNLFLNHDKLVRFIDGLFVIEREINISSAYYLVSRVIYSKICDEQKKSTDYYDDHHRLAAALPFVGEYGPVRLVILRKA
jgi:ubiquinone/menaquinone biosynthesis C-methylase UbiE